MPTFDIFQNETDLHSFGAGQVIFSEGDAGDFLYAVLDGKVEIRKKDKMLRIIGKGGIFGEMALIDKKPRSASAISRTECTLALINQKRFLTLIQQTPFFAIQMMKVLTERIRANEES